MCSVNTQREEYSIIARTIIKIAIYRIRYKFPRLGMSPHHFLDPHYRLCMIITFLHNEINI